MEPKTVVILGAGWAGLSLAHQLLQNVAPKVPGTKVILVSPNSHFFWNIAAPRGVISGEISDSHLFSPILPAFDHYQHHEQFEFILGAARSIGHASNTVQIQLNQKQGDVLTRVDTLREVVYDHLIIATGSRIVSNLPFKSVGSYEDHLEAWHELQAKIDAAGTIVIAGGGPTGVEVAGELASKFGRTKEITLVENSESLLYGRLPSVSETAERDLEKLGVRMIYKNRATQSADDDSHTIHLSKGGTLTADLFLPLYGVVVNNAFIPDELMDWEGNLKLDSTLRVVGTTNIWGVGDVGNVEPKQLSSVLSQVEFLSGVLESVLVEGKPVEEISKVYTPVIRSPLFIALGRHLATGQFGSWKIFGFIVSFLKGRKLYLNNASGFIGGKTRQPFF
ncbi:unnamed protein product [Clonostachys rosea f. rosea IK726]|uniref:FAD/NAD(P)-binding domain-containing protein n=2 Tax=Bionectria ochroleuca TaxID=29856 RepID=A0A0B7KF67_BIOOC|nr:unnamed protein product [Clonostachys rosea f. rosea IK726]